LSRRLPSSSSWPGLDLIAIQDHAYNHMFVDTWTLITYLAGRTEQIHFMPDVADLPLRPPPMLANAVATLDRLTDGRAELAIGAGAFWDAINFVAMPLALSIITPASR
jgi:alkanesulfonate monooxygenase SsuD/methylene tetrahydromethanopterin reductase-like flavin-dependent oxidoreductase (luciferase family)